MKNICAFAAAALLAGSAPVLAQQQAGPGTPPHSADAGQATKNGSNSMSGSMPTGATPHSSTPSGTMSGSSSGMNGGSMAADNNSMTKKKSKKKHSTSTAN